MPRANRYMLPGRTCHLTHRCHNRAFLFRFAGDRREYGRRLRLAVREFRISLLGYCITSNHTHLLARAEGVEAISAFMRYRVLDMDEILELHVEPTRESFALNYRAGLEGNLVAGSMGREPEWTESLAVGAEGFVKAVERETRNRLELEVAQTGGGAWVIRETPAAYTPFSGSKS